MEVESFTGDQFASLELTLLRVAYRPPTSIEPLYIVQIEQFRPVVRTPIIRSKRSSTFRNVRLVRAPRERKKKRKKMATVREQRRVLRCPATNRERSTTHHGK